MVETGESKLAKKMNYQGKNSEVIQQQNRLLVLRLIREKKVISRVELAELTGLKQATITNIINELIDRGYVEEAGLIEGKNGRRVKGIILNDEKMRILVSRITSEYYAVGIYDLNGDCIRVEKKFWDKTNSFQEKLEMIRDNLFSYIEQYGRGKQIIGTGIVIEGSIANMDMSFTLEQNSDMEKVLKEYFLTELGMAVFVDNMSNMSAYYEWNQQIAKEKKMHTLVCLMIGYAVDCSVIFDGNVLKGRNGRAGHYGHVSIDLNGPVCECGNRGCIRNYISVKAVKEKANLLREKYPDMILENDCNIRDIIRAYYDGEAFARELYEDMADKYGLIVANLINQFNPEEIILGDEVPNSDEFIELVRSYTKKRLPKHRYERTEITFFKAPRMTEFDVGMRGMCLFVINEQLKNMELD